MLNQVADGGQCHNFNPFWNRKPGTPPDAKDKAVGFGWSTDSPCAAFRLRSLDVSPAKKSFNDFFRNTFVEKSGFLELPMSFSGTIAIQNVFLNIKNQGKFQPFQANH
ncbi:MAG: hypothetical protein Q4C95_05005 [Planctomycetia bacterium]|nr:hypothetical protein [Planctomycetia bacterium]